MFQLENTLSRKHFLLFPSVNKSFREMCVFSKPFTCKTLLCSFNLGGGKTVPLWSWHSLLFELTTDIGAGGGK